jgi:hypothetical protein
VGSCAIAAVARRRGVAAPILLVLTGLAASYIPGVPEFRLNPDLVLFAVLPPLVYTTALESSYLTEPARQRADPGPAVRRPGAVHGPDGGRCRAA